MNPITVKEGIMNIFNCNSDLLSFKCQGMNGQPATLINLFYLPNLLSYE